jgi:hypothetical protein
MAAHVVRDALNACIEIEGGARQQLVGDVDQLLYRIWHAHAAALGAAVEDMHEPADLPW